MASNKYLVFAVLFITIPFIENAPSDNRKNPSEDELHTRLVFIDNSDNIIARNSDSRSQSTTPLLPTLKQRSEVTRSKHITKQVTGTEPVVTRKSEPTKMDDERQNWGIVIEETDLNEEESYYNRPLSLPKTITVKIPETQKKTTEVKPEVTLTKVSNTIEVPDPCDTGIVKCCGSVSDVITCLKSENCINISDDMLSSVCSENSVNKAVQNVVLYYKKILAN